MIIKLGDCAVEIGHNLDERNCTFYFIMDSDNKSSVLKEEIRRAVCKKVAREMEIHTYSARFGAVVRSVAQLQKEFSQTIPEMINIIYVRKEEKTASLLSMIERDAFFEKVMEFDAGEEDEDTLPLVKEIIEKIGSPVECIN